MKSFSSIWSGALGAGNRRESMVRSRGAVRLAAGVGALSLLALGVGVGTGAAAQPPTSTAASASPSTSPSSTVPPPDTLPADGGALNIVVGKAVDAATDAAGQVSAVGLYTSTNLSGAGAATVKVPIGTDNPVDVNSFSKLQTENQSVVYNINNAGGQVQTLIASGGQFKAQLPVTFTVDLKVNGQSVDPNTATSITGNVELSYIFTNHTSTVENITYKDAAGNMVTKSANVGVPFSISYDGTFGNGWANLVAPWANSGFSAGQIITGGTSMFGYSPTATLKITGTAQNAAVPSANIRITPSSVSGSLTSILGKVDTGGTKIAEILGGKAIPMLTEVEQGIGKGAGELSKILKTKVDPLLKLVSKLHVDPTKVNSLLEKGGQDLAGLGNILLGVNAATEGGTAKLAELAATATSPAAQAKLGSVVKALTAAQKGLGEALKGLALLKEALASQTLASVVAALGIEIPSVAAAYVCPGGTPCTLGQLLDANLVDQLPYTCSTGQATNTAWGPTGSPVQLALNAAIAMYTAGSTTEVALQALKTNLTNQAAVPIPANCTEAATGMKTALNGMFGSLGELFTAIEDLVPFLQELDDDLGNAIPALTELQDEMPAMNNALDNDCGATSAFQDLSGCGLIQQMEIVTNANAKGKVILDEGILQLVADIEPAMDNLFGVVNDLATTAPLLAKELDELPSLLLQLGGDLGSFLPGLESLDEMATKLTDVASETIEVNKAIDVKFNAGEGFPYGHATGGDAATSASYKFELAAAKTGVASQTATVAYALIMLLLGAALATWLTLRKRA